MADTGLKLDWDRWAREAREREAKREEQLKRELYAALGPDAEKKLEKIVEDASLREHWCPKCRRAW